MFQGFFLLEYLHAVALATTTYHKEFHKSRDYSGLYGIKRKKARRISRPFGGFLTFSSRVVGADEGGDEGAELLLVSGVGHLGKGGQAGDRKSVV